MAHNRKLVLTSAFDTGAFVGVDVTSATAPDAPSPVDGRAADPNAWQTLDFTKLPADLSTPSAAPLPPSRSGAGGSTSAEQLVARYADKVNPYLAALRRGELTPSDAVRIAHEREIAGSGHRNRQGYMDVTPEQETMAAWMGIPVQGRLLGSNYLDGAGANQFKAQLSGAMQYDYPANAQRRAIVVGPGATVDDIFRTALYDIGGRASPVEYALLYAAAERAALARGGIIDTTIAYNQSVLGARSAFDSSPAVRTFDAALSPSGETFESGLGYAAMGASDRIAYSVTAKDGARIGNFLNDNLAPADLRSGARTDLLITATLTLAPAALQSTRWVKAANDIISAVRAGERAFQFPVGIPAGTLSSNLGGLRWRGVTVGNTPIVKRGVLEFQGLEVRAVRNLSHLDEGTLRAMQQYGFAAKDVKGNALILHHHQQNPAGPIIEMPAVNHNIGNLRQHPFGNTKGAGLTAEQRAQFNQWRTDYWKWRATQELQTRGLK